MRLFVFLTIICLTPICVFAAPTKAKIYLTASSVQALINSPKEGTQKTPSIPFTLQYNGKSNQGLLKLRQEPLLSKPILGLEGLRLFKGTTRRGGKRLSVAASLIDGNLKVSFKDGARLYQSEFDLSLSALGPLEGFLSRSPAYLRIDEGGRPSPVSNIMQRNSLNYLSEPGTLASEMMIELRAVADGSLVTLKGGILKAFTHILDTINAGESIYTSQLNTIIRVVDMAVVPNSALSSTNAYNLLDQFTEVEEGDAAENHDLSHLFTGKDLNGGIVGLAWSPIVCISPEVRYGLSQMRAVGALAPIIFAHEIGHNLGAGHDEVTPSLMYPVVSVSHDSFSSFSLGEINDFLASASFCLDKDTSEADPVLSNYLIANVTVFNSGRLRVKADLFNEESSTSDCIVSLYGATQKAKLQENNLTSQATLLGTFGADLGDVKLRVGGQPKSVQGPKRLHFRLVSYCTGGQSLSPIFTLRLEAGGTIDRGEWLNTLAGKTLNVIPY